MNDQTEVYADPSFREAVLAQSIKVMRHGRRRGYYVVVAAVLAAYGAGIGSLMLVQGKQSTRSATPVVASVVVAAPARTHQQDPQTLLKQVAGASRPEQVLLLTEAGDIYLNVRADIERALNCYRQVLEITPANVQMTIHPEDTWLFKSLKKARVKEIDHAETSS